STARGQKAERLTLVAEYPKLGGHKERTESDLVRGQILFSHVDTNFLMSPKKLASAPPMGPREIDTLVKKEIYTRRRHMLLGETVDSLHVADIVHAIQSIHASSK